jgi:hypothetical protein
VERLQRHLCARLACIARHDITANVKKKKCRSDLIEYLDVQDNKRSIITQ